MNGAYVVQKYTEGLKILEEGGSLEKFWAHGYATGCSEGADQYNDLCLHLAKLNELCTAIVNSTPIPTRKTPAFLKAMEAYQEQIEVIASHMEKP